MRNLILVLALAAGVGLVCAGSPPAEAADKQDIHMVWALRPEATQIHPKKVKLAYVVTTKHQVSQIGVVYTLYRTPMDASDPMEERGTFTAKLKVLRGDQTIKFGAKKGRVTWGCGGHCKGAEVRWNDPSGCAPPGECTTGYSTDLLPLTLEPGDVVMWTVRFKGFPKLKVQNDSERVQVDVPDLWTSECNCGTYDHPCSN